MKTKLESPTLKNQSEQFTALMTSFLGIDPQICIDYEVVRPHYPGLCDYVSAREAAGQPLPEGIDPNRVESYVAVSFVRKKGVVE